MELGEEEDGFGGDRGGGGGGGEDLGAVWGCGGRSDCDRSLMGCLGGRGGGLDAWSPDETLKLRVNRML